MPRTSIAKLARDQRKADDKNRQAARDSLRVQSAERKGRKQATVDSFVNYAQSMGVGADNPLTTASYGFNPITRIRTLLEWIYRGSWLAGVSVDVIAEDMTRAGVEIQSDELQPDAVEQIEGSATQLAVWEKLSETIKWSRLYGGAIAIMLIKGQSMSTPLRIETVGRDQFKGLFVLDRWMVDVSMSDLVTELGPDLGMPKYYQVLADAPGLRNERIHYSRVVRFDGIQLPYWQRIQENMWGISILERLYDRMIAYDSATTGAAQLVYRSYIRTYKVPGLRQIIAQGGDALAGLYAFVDLMRKFQGTEGITLLDGDDEFEVNQRQSFAGLDDIMGKFEGQISGAIQVPLVRLLGQSPAGLSASGESDLRNYYDGINQRQERELRLPVMKVYAMIAQSNGVKLPDGTKLVFSSLWQLSDVEKADIAEKTTNAVTAAEGSLISQQTALKELRQSSAVTGIFANISDEEINAASDEAPPTASEQLETQLSHEKDMQQRGGEQQKELAQQGEKNNEGGGKTARTQDNNALAAVLAMKAIHDLDLVVETRKGEQRVGKDHNGKPFTNTMLADYGYARRATADDGDEPDVFIGPHHASTLVLRINQVNPDTQAPDEPKFMLGYMNAEAALYDYTGSYDDDRADDRIGSVDYMNIAGFKEYLAEPAQAYRFTS